MSVLGRSGVFSRSLHSSAVMAMGRPSTFKYRDPNAWKEPRNLNYEAELIQKKLDLTSNNWSPPRGNYEHLPFRVFRTAQRQLPVYAYHRGNGHYRTKLRRFRGDVVELVREMSKVCDGRPIEIHKGSLAVAGAYREPLIAWLTRLGF